MSKFIQVSSVVASILSALIFVFYVTGLLSPSPLYIGGQMLLITALFATLAIVESDKEGEDGAK